MVTTTTDAEVNGLPTASTTLNDVARANRETGVLLATKEQLVTAIQDRRCKREHLRVLAAVATFMNAATAKAWPGRAAIAGLLGFSLKTVSNTLTELRGWGYLIAEKEAVPEANNRSLTVYTWGKIDHATIRREIEAFVAGVREGRIPDRRHGDVPLPRGTPKATSSPPAGLPHPRGTQNAPEFPSSGARNSPPAGDSNSKKELKRESAPQPHFGRHERSPYLDENGDFVISDKHRIFIPADIVLGWRDRFSAIADLEAQMQKLSAYILKGGIQHPGWNCPEGWMAGCLATDNQKAKGQQPRSAPMKTFRR